MTFLHAAPPSDSRFISASLFWKNVAALTTRVDLAADARGDVDPEAELTLDRGRTQAYVTFCWGPKDG